MLVLKTTCLLDAALRLRHAVDMLARVRFVTRPACVRGMQTPAAFACVWCGVVRCVCSQLQKGVRARCNPGQTAIEWRS